MSFPVVSLVVPKIEKYYDSLIVDIALLQTALRVLGSHRDRVAPSLADVQCLREAVPWEAELPIDDLAVFVVQREIEAARN